ncbi:hypothetical protein C8R45DRAFT_1004551, partial [Mycena sanguinolenta]
MINRHPIEFNQVRPASHMCARAHATRSVQHHHSVCDVRDARCRARMTYGSKPFRLSCVHIQSASQTLKSTLEYQEGVNALATIFSSTAVRTVELWAPSDALDAFSTLLMPASLERSIRRGPRPTAPLGNRRRRANPTHLTPCRREPKPDLHHQLHGTLASLRPVLFSRVLPSPPDTCACRAPRHHLHDLLRTQ